MKKTFVFNLILAGVLFFPAFAAAQTTAPSFLGGISDTQPGTVLGATTPGEEATFEALKDKPLPERRRIVANELKAIALRFDTLLQKTTAATTRLGENGIVIEETMKLLQEAQTSLSATHTTIDELIRVSHDPLNEQVISLTVGTLSFKESVLVAEKGLRTTREQIVNALGTLKAAVQASIVAQ